MFMLEFSWVNEDSCVVDGGVILVYSSVTLMDRFVFVAVIRGAAFGALLLLLCFFTRDIRRQSYGIAVGTFFLILVREGSSVTNSLLRPHGLIFVNGKMRKDGFCGVCLLVSFKLDGSLLGEGLI